MFGKSSKHSVVRNLMNKHELVCLKVLERERERDEGPEGRRPSYSEFQRGLSHDEPENDSPNQTSPSKDGPVAFLYLLNLDLFWDEAGFAHFVPAAVHGEKDVVCIIAVDGNRR
jgi:hypothetical protein